MHTSIITCTQATTNVEVCCEADGHLAGVSIGTGRAYASAACCVISMDVGSNTKWAQLCLKTCSLTDVQACRCIAGCGMKTSLSLLCSAGAEGACSEHLDTNSNQKELIHSLSVAAIRPMAKLYHRGWEPCMSTLSAAVLSCWCVARWCTAKGMRCRVPRSMLSWKHQLLRKGMQHSPAFSCQVRPQLSSLKHVTAAPVTVQQGLIISALDSGHNVYAELKATAAEEEEATQPSILLHY